MRTREATLGPTIRGTVHVEEGVFLLDTEPGHLLLSKVHDLRSMVTEVGAVGSAVAVVALGENKDVVAAPEGVLEDGSRAEVDVGVVTGRLVRGRTIEVPDPQGADVGHLLGDCLGTRSQCPPPRLSTDAHDGVVQQGQRVKGVAVREYSLSPSNGDRCRHQSRRLEEEKGEVVAPQRGNLGN